MFVRPIHTDDFFSARDNGPDQISAPTFHSTYNYWKSIAYQNGSAFLNKSESGMMAGKESASAVEMVPVRLNGQLQVSANSGMADVSDSNFGSIYTTYLPLDRFMSGASIGHVRSIRWPGGTLAEMDVDKYSLRFRDVFAEPNPGATDYDPGRQKGLTEVMAEAVRTNSEFSMVIPTRRYMTDVSTGVADLKAFLVRLLKGDFGQLPEHFTLEIGNESFWLGWQDGVFTPGEGSYGYIANAYLEVIHKVLENPALNPRHLDIDVALQIGTSDGPNQAPILSQISAQNLRTVDVFVRHNALIWNGEPWHPVTNPHGYDFAHEDEVLADVRAYWNRAWGRAAPEMVVADSAWNIGGSDTAEELVWPNQFALGAKQAGAVVKIFSQLIASGSDSCAVWGAHNKASALFGVDGSSLSYGGHAFRLMAESLSGTTMSAGKIRNGNWLETNTKFDVVSFQDDSKIVVFVSAKDISASGVDVHLDLSAFGPLSYAWGESISSRADGRDHLNPANAFDVEVQQITVPIAHLVATDTITVSLRDDYELVRIIVARSDPGAGTLYLMGSNASEVLLGGSSGDLLIGNGGNDRIEGAASRDVLLGGLGSDTMRGGDGRDSLDGGQSADLIFGGQGPDTMSGGTGDDVFVFQSWDDRGDLIKDFSHVTGNNDTLYFKVSMFSGLATGRISSSIFALDFARDANDRFIYVQDSGQLLYDADGSLSGAAKLLVNFSISHAPLTAYDIILI